MLESAIGFYFAGLYKVQSGNLNTRFFIYFLIVLNLNTPVLEF